LAVEYLREVEKLSEIYVKEQESMKQVLEKGKKDQ
jgi:hypothetical protein